MSIWIGIATNERLLFAPYLSTSMRRAFQIRNRSTGQKNTCIKGIKGEARDALTIQPHLSTYRPNSRLLRRSLPGDFIAIERL